jgi:Ca2+-dependent lipid-binding protein
LNKPDLDFKIKSTSASVDLSHIPIANLLIDKTISDVLVELMLFPNKLDLNLGDTIVNARRGIPFFLLFLFFLSQTEIHHHYRSGRTKL